MQVSSIEKWRYIFLDTSVIIDFLSMPERLVKNPQHQQRVKKTHQLFDYLSTKDGSTDNRPTWFYISAITIGELRKFQTDGDLILEIVELLNCGNVTFVDYTRETAHFLHRNILNYLPTNQLRELVRALERELYSAGIASARQWISDDLKISVSARTMRKVDAVLTGDIKTFYPLAQAMNLPVYYTYELPLDMFGELDTGKEY